MRFFLLLFPSSLVFFFFFANIIIYGQYYLFICKKFVRFLLKKGIALFTQCFATLSLQAYSLSHLCILFKSTNTNAFTKYMFMRIIRSGKIFNGTGTYELDLVIHIQFGVFRQIGKTSPN